MDETSAVFHELLDEMRSLERTMLDHPQALSDEQSRCETYKWIFSITQVAFDCFVWGDVARPRFVEIVGPDKKWGGDNADAFYQLAAVDGARRYRVRGRRGDSAYLSLTLYGGPARDGSYGAQRTVATLNDRAMRFAPDGSFELRGLLEREYRIVAMDLTTLQRVRVGPIAAGTEDVQITFPAEGLWELDTATA